MFKKFNDIKGKRYGKLLVKEPKRNKFGRFAWLCICDCGNECITSSTSLEIGDNVSCGCSKKERLAACWKGCGDISGTYWKVIYNRAKNNAIEFTITIEYIWELFLKQNRKCVYSNEELIFVRCYNEECKSGQTASLDRIDSSKGYIEGNVQWVHKHVNKMKMELSEDIFIDFCKKVAYNARAN